MSHTSLNIQNHFEVQSPMENTHSRRTQPGSAALPLSKRISSIFREFSTGMKLAQHHHENQDFGLDILASHNLRLLQKRLEQIPEYIMLMQEKKQETAETGDLWTCLFEENELTCGFIKLQPHLDMPFYSHPGQSSMCLILSGRLDVKYYALRRKQDNPAKNSSDNQTSFSLLSYHGASESDAVYCQSDTNSLTNLCTGSEACLLLNIQLSGHHMTRNKQAG